MSKKVQPLRLDFDPVERASITYNEFISDVKAGFPSSSDDFMNESIDLNIYVSTHPATIYYARADIYRWNEIL